MVAIISGIGINMTMGRVDSEDYTRSLLIQLNDAQRKSAGRGPIDDMVEAEYGWQGPGGEFPRARVYWQSVGSNRYASVLEVVVDEVTDREDPSTATVVWKELSRVFLPEDVSPAKWCSNAHLAANVTAQCVMFQPNVTLGCPDDDILGCDAATYCYPNGRCDSSTFGVSGKSTKSRVVVMPLNGAIVRPGA